MVKLILTIVVSASPSMCFFNASNSVVQPMHSWQQHHREVGRVFFSPDSQRVITQSNNIDEPVTVRSALTGDIQCAWARSIRISSNVALNNRWLFVDTDGLRTAHIRDITNCNYIRYIDLDVRNHFSTRFSSDGRFLAGTAHRRLPIFSKNQWAYIYDLENEQLVNRVVHPSRNFLGLADDKFHFFRDGQTVLMWFEVRKKVRMPSGERRTFDRRIVMQNLITEQIHRQFYFRIFFYQLAIHPDESRITIFDRDAMRLRMENLHPYKHLTDWPALKPAFVLEFHPSGKWLMSVSAHGDVVVYDIATQEPVQEYRIATQWPIFNGLAFAPNGKSFAIGTFEGNVAIYPFKLPIESKF